MYFIYSEIFVTTFSSHKFRCKITTFLGYMQEKSQKNDKIMRFFRLP